MLSRHKLSSMGRRAFSVTLTTENYSTNRCARSLTDQTPKTNPNPNPNPTTKQHAIRATERGVQAVHCTGAHDQKRSPWKHHGTILHHISSLCWKCR